MTLKGHYPLCFKTHAFSEPTTKIWMKTRWCSPVTLDSGNIRFMRIFAGVPWRGGVKQQWGNRKRRFSSFRALRLRHLRKWGQTMDGHFTFNFQFSLLWTAFQRLGYTLLVQQLSLFTEKYFCVTSPPKIRRIGQWNCNPQNIAAPRKDCGSFLNEKLRALRRRNLNK